MEEFEIYESVLQRYNGCNNVVDIPYGVQRIGQGAFRGNTTLKAIAIPNGVQEIECFAFCDCINLTQVILPKSILCIRTFAFGGCYRLKLCTIPAIATLEKDVFAGCNSLVVENDKNLMRYADAYRFAKVSQTAYEQYRNHFLKAMEWCENNLD